MTVGRRHFLGAFVTLAFSWLQIACLANEPLPAGSSGVKPGSQPIGTQVRSITLPHFEPELPAAPGRSQYLQVCVSCHSARYVTMQPLLSQAQWEQETDKMAKTYGAQMDSEQRRFIISYLVAIHGPDSAKKEVPGADDDFGSAPASASSLQAELAPALQLAANPEARARQMSWGAELFKQHCVACHGTSGKGDGWVAPVLLRRPKDLTATRFSMELLSQVLWNGKPGTAMPSWRGLPQPDLAALATYVQALHRPGKPEQISPELLRRGKQVFQLTCAPCHGIAGDGKGPAAATLTPEPANFQLKQPDTSYLLRVVREGIPGTAMPAWQRQISEADREAVAAFVRSLFRPADAKGESRP